jgi:hypothetical protein
VRKPLPESSLRFRVSLGALLYGRQPAHLTIRTADKRGPE